jgi:hypothetical protein
VELFAGFTPEHRDVLYELLGRLRVQVSSNATTPPSPHIARGRTARQEPSE